MYKLVNKESPFLPYDVVKIKKTKELVVVTEVNCNTSQVEDKHQWSYSISHINPKSKSHTAWYSMDELEYVNNIFEIISRQSTHPFSSNKFALPLIRRQK